MNKKKVNINRQNFCNIINEKEYKTGAEIGLGFGSYSQFLLENSNLEKLYSIDPFDPGGHEHYNGLELTKEKLSHFPGRSVFVRKTSEEAAVGFEDETLDFIYIDGDHRKEYVEKDLLAWYPKLKKNGLFSGHDYCEITYGCGGVVTAVDEFCESYNIETLYITSVTDLPLRENREVDLKGGMEEQVGSWFFYKQ